MYNAHILHIKYIVSLRVKYALTQYVYILEYISNVQYDKRFKSNLIFTIVPHFTEYITHVHKLFTSVEG
jgi:hypothetical protein